VFAVDELRTFCGQASLIMTFTKQIIIEIVGMQVTAKERNWLWPYGFI